MKPNITRIPQNDGYITRLFCHETAHTEVLGSILILHGMAEHQERYLPFVRLLNKEGFDVYTYDQRGHGTDKKLSELGFFANKNGASLVINDAIHLCKYIKENSRSKKLAVFGHSMGSLILRNVIQQYDSIDCALVSATTMPDLSITNAGILLANLLCLLQGPKKQSGFLDHSIFGGKLYSSLCTRTSFDWLTRNNTIIGQYINDPYCGFLCTTSFYRDLMTLSKYAAIKKNIAKTRKDLPVFFIVGSKDPVSSYSKEVVKLHRIFEQLGFTKTSLTIYPEARHELLNELNADDVMNDAIEFFHTHLG